MNNFCRTHDLSIPVILAPMAGGPSTPELVAAVSNAGGLGTLAAAYSSPEKIAEDIARVRELTSRRFAVNLFSPQAQLPLKDGIKAVADFLRPYHERLGLKPPELPRKASETFDEQFDAVVKAAPPAFSFTFGMLPTGATERLKAENTYVIGTATTVEEARQLQQAGVDAVVAQGSEAGAHRGTFAVPAEEALIGTVALVPQVVDALRIPVIASGGIMDGRGIVAALALGASAVQMGTAFLNCKEAGTSAPYRAALVKAREDQTTLTRAFSGRMARGLHNEFIDQWSAAGIAHLPYPWQNAFTQQMRRAAASAQQAGMLSLWAGQGVRMLRESSAQKLMTDLQEEIQRAWSELKNQLQS
ncbi:MAG TPA: nitronate monooxygenase [Candidatus Angelobacter sp.]|nr:nitronate monooxygenase [Candidatus Angelobacter sp.]